MSSLFRLKRAVVVPGYAWSATATSCVDPAVRMDERVRDSGAPGPGFDEFRERAARALSVHAGSLSVEVLNAARDLPDDTLKLLVRKTNGTPSAVILYSGAGGPDIVRRATDAARAARSALGPELGSVAPLPLDEGWLDGRSYAILPFIGGFSRNRVLRFGQRRWLAPAVFGWLRRATAATLASPSPQTDAAFQRALLDVVQRARMPRDLRTAAEDALTRLQGGQWKPRHVLMHGDLWFGNILSQSSNLAQIATRKFVVIDWPGGRVRGFPIYDLSRLCASVGSSARRYRSELLAHARILGCQARDVEANLLSALGHIGQHLEHFPEERYIGMAVQSVHSVRVALADQTLSRHHGVTPPDVDRTSTVAP